MIATIAGTEHREGARSIQQVEVSDALGLHRAWEFTCDDCDEICTMLPLAEAEAELREHVCLLPCERVG